MADHTIVEPDNSAPEADASDLDTAHVHGQHSRSRVAEADRRRRPVVLAAVGVVAGIAVAGVAAATQSLLPWQSTSQTSSTADAAPPPPSEPTPATDPARDPSAKESSGTVVAPTTTAPPAEATTTTTQPAEDGEDETAAATFGWDLLDADEFDGSEVDTGRWTLYEGPGNGGVGLRSPEAISQSDGTLKITGRGDVSGGMNWNDGGRVYGRWEIRARSDAGTGYAPNLLLWPSSGNWPEEGEVNIMEIPLGDRSQSLSVLHYGADNKQYFHWEHGDFTQWHNFALEWQPDRVTVYIDGEEIVSWDDPEAIPRDPMHLAIQNDVGPHDGFIPARDETTPDEVSLEVDWVRIYAP